MALSAAQVWEVRTTGSDSNGGAFKAGATGTDFSQQDAAQVAFTDLVIDATTATNLTSAGNPFTSAHVGNVVNVASGTGFTPGRYEVISVAGAVATMDRAVGTTSSTGGTGNLGGALATLATLAGATGMIASNKAFVKAGAGYTTTATITFAQSVTPTATAPASRLIGYTTTRGDGGRATLTLSTNTGLSGLRFTGNGWFVDNMAVDCASLGTSIGIEVAGIYSGLRNCKASNFTFIGLFVSGGGFSSFYRCEATGGLATATGAAVYVGGVASVQVVHCYVHDNACRGIRLDLGNAAVGNVIANNSGATSDGINASYNTLILGNTIYRSGQHGIAYTGGNNFGSQVWVNNLLAENGGYGILGGSAAGLPADVLYDGNAFYLNTSGARSNMDDAGAVNAVNGVVPYANPFDVLLTADPFVAKASNDFRLNTTAGGGAAVRGHGLPAAWPGNSLTAGYRDFGAIQHQDSATGGMIPAILRSPTWVYVG